MTPNIADLPAEILDCICAMICDSQTLACIRLASPRRLSTYPEPYLFRHVRLGTRPRDTNVLRSLATHARISIYVQSLTFHLGPGTHHSITTYELQAASTRSRSSVERAHREHSAGSAQQTAKLTPPKLSPYLLTQERHGVGRHLPVNYPSCDELFTFAMVLQRLPNLSQVRFGGGECTVRRPTELGKVQPEESPHSSIDTSQALATSHWQRQETWFVAVFLHALFNCPNKVSSLRLQEIQPDVMTCLRQISEFPSLQPLLHDPESSLGVQKLELVLPASAGDEDETSYPTLKKAWEPIPDLQELYLRVEPPPSHLWRSPLTAWIPPVSLKRLTLHNVKLEATQFQDSLLQQRSTIRELILRNCELEHGYWIDVFEATRSLPRFPAFQITISPGRFLDEDGAWDLEQPIEETNCKKTGTGLSLFTRLQSYLRHEAKDRPLSLSNQAGAQDQWKRMSDKSMHWRRWDAWQEWGDNWS